MASNDWEAARKAQIEKNQARLRELGLLETVRAINSTQAQARQQGREQRAAKKAAAAAAPRVPTRVRRSERCQGKEPTNYNERALARLGLEEDEEGGRKPRLLRENTTEEVYTFEQVKLLGSAAQPWELFVDGYDASGERIYDKVNGQTCHQCRQKTLGKRTACSCCQSLRGVFCGDCLYMRYGENVEEVNANPEWVCPVCRDLCNCSFHRIKKGWAPTGTLYRAAMREGFQSVAHYLVLTNLREEDRPAAAHLMPEGWEYPEKEKEEEAAAQQAEQAQQAQQQQAAEQQEASGSGEAAAVEEQLLSLDEEEAQPASSGAEAPAAAAPARRTRRGQRGAVAAAQQQAEPTAPAAPAALAAEPEAAAEGAAAKGTRRSGRSGKAAGRQVTLVEVSRATKRKATEPAGGATPAAAKKAAVAEEGGKGFLNSARRGLRSMLRGAAFLAGFL